MIRCPKCNFFKATEKSKCCCNVKPFDEKKLIKKTTAIKQISEKKEKRIEENGTEIKLFQSKFTLLRKKNQNICTICGKTIYEDDLTPSMFAHLFAKGLYPDMRYMLNNISLVCGIDHHKELDEKFNKYKKINGAIEVEQLIRSGKDIIFDTVINS